MKTPTTREIFEAMHAAPKAPAPISGPVLGGGAVGVKSVLFERVKEAREAGKRLGLVERIKAGGEVSEDTAETYAATTRRRIDLDAPGGGRLMAGVSAASWHATRAALLWGAARAWHKAMRDQDAAQKAGDMAGAMTHARRALAATVAIEAVEAAERPAPTKRRASKRATLPAAADWQRRVFDGATPAQRPAVALLWATGCRPAEIEKGVDVGRDDRGRLMVRIPGAKVHEGHGAGQPVRLLLIDEASPAGIALAGILGDARRLTVKRSATRLNKDFEAIRRRVGGTASPYSMRHQVAADLKAVMEVEDVAAALGHRVTRSQLRYGSIRQAKGGTAIVAARATYPVKETRPSVAAQKSGPDAGPGL
jgi:integrase